jgi:hypothetical protein
MVLRSDEQCGVVVLRSDVVLRSNAMLRSVEQWWLFRSTVNTRFLVHSAPMSVPNRWHIGRECGVLLIL